jgi:hypothetical protein
MVLLKKKVSMFELGVILGKLFADVSPEVVSKVMDTLDISINNQTRQRVFEVFCVMLYELHIACRKRYDTQVASRLTDNTVASFMAIIQNRLDIMSGQKSESVNLEQLALQSANRINEYLQIFRNNEGGEAIMRYGLAITENIKGSQDALCAMKVVLNFLEFGKYLYNMLGDYKITS